MNKNKIAHRDLKPENIMVHKNKNNNYIFKIGDFGFSTKISQIELFSSRVGTLNYMDPAILGY